MSLTLPPWPGAYGCGDPGDPISFACLFDGGQQLQLTPAAAADRTRAFIDLWVKRGKLGQVQNLINVWNGVNNTRTFSLQFTADDTLQLSDYNGVDTFYLRRVTTAMYRDPNAAMHIRVEIDTNLAAGDARARLLVNREEPSYKTGNDGYPEYVNPTAAFSVFLGSNTATTVGANAAGGVRLHATLARFAYGVGAIGSVNDFTYLNGQNVPVPAVPAYPAGAEGSFFTFDDAADFGVDSSGQANDFTSSGFTADNQLADTPTDNFATASPIDASANVGLNDGNLAFQMTGGNYYSAAGCTAVLPHDEGKVYWEAFTGTVTNGTSARNYGVGEVGDGDAFQLRNGSSLGDVALYQNAWGSIWTAGGWKFRHPSTTDLYVSGDTTELGRTHGFAYDAAAQTLDWYLDGVFQYQATGVTGIGLRPVFGPQGDDTVNFGQRAFTHTPPTGFAPLSSAQLVCPTILDPDDYFTVRTPAGGADVSDLPWDATAGKTLVVSKRLDSATSWRVVDSVQGAASAWASDDATNGTVAEADGLTAFTATGYTIGANAAWQGNRVDYVWRASARAGFDIVGPINHVNGTPSTVTHAAGGVLDYAWVVRSDAGQDRRIFHRDLGGDDYIVINDQLTAVADAGWFGSTISDLTLDGSLPTGTYYVYCWRAVPQFSFFGAYNGSGEASNGPDIPMDFSPRMVWSARSDAGDSHPVADIDRSPANPAAKRITTNNPGVEDATYDLYDLLGAGAKVRNLNYDTSGGRYLVAAWASVPAKFARAR